MEKIKLYRSFTQYALDLWKQEMETEIINGWPCRTKEVLINLPKFYTASRA